VSKTNATMFVAMPMEELLQLIENRILIAISKFDLSLMQSQNNELLNVEEACELLHVSKVTIHKWKKKRLIRSYRIGRKIFFKKNELIESFH